MGTIYLSDLHFLDGSRADDFGRVDGEWPHLRLSDADVDLLAKLDQWKAEGESVVLVGDIFDLWQADYESIMRAHEPVIRRLLAVTTVWVLGNHDAKARRHPPGAPITWQHCGVVDGIYIEHGHRHDPVISRLPRLSRLITRGVGWLERKVHKDIDHWGERLARWIGRTGRHGSGQRYAEEIAKCAHDHGCNIAVFGHTHEKGEWTIKVKGTEIHVYNCGTWTNGRRDFVKL